MRTCVKSMLVLQCLDSPSVPLHVDYVGFDSATAFAIVLPDGVHEGEVGLQTPLRLTASEVKIDVQHKVL